MTCFSCGGPLTVPDENRNLPCACGQTYQVIWFRGRRAMDRYESWRIAKGYMTAPVPANLITAVELGNS